MSVIERARVSPWPAISMAEAYKVIEDECAPLGTRTVPTASVRLNDCVAEDVTSAFNVPEVCTSVKDGYAVLAADAPGPRRVIGYSTAGSPCNAKLQSGECVRVSTGAFVPDSADAVVMVENTVLLEHDNSEELVIEVRTPAKRGQDIRMPGSDTAVGDLLLEKGSVIKSAELGLVLASGYLRERVCEATARSIPLGHIRDTNRPQLLALCAQHNAAVTDMGIVGDDLVSGVARALESSDVLISSGGVSMGEKDLMKSVLRDDFGFELRFGRVFMKPGLPTTFATGHFRGRKKLVFALPGNPASSWVCAQLFAIPAIKKLRGERSVRHTEINVKLSEAVRLDPRPEFRRAFISAVEEGALPTAITTGNQVSSRLVSLKGAQLLLALPGRTDQLSELEQGAVVRALVIEKP